MSSNSGVQLDMVSTGASTTIAQSDASTELRPAIMSVLLQELTRKMGTQHLVESGAHDISWKALKVTNKASWVVVERDLLSKASEVTNLETNSSKSKIQ